MVVWCWELREGVVEVVVGVGRASVMGGSS